MFEPTVGVRVCASCALRIGQLAREEPQAHWAPGGELPSSPDPNDRAFGTMLRGFQRGVAERISAADSESHYHLAHAYRAMGLYADAVTAAGTALSTEAPPAAKTATESALCLLLTAPLLEDGGLEALRTRLADL